MALQIATYEQILTILSQLAENYTNLFDIYYEMFYSTTPQDVVLKVYDENGQQQSISLPNRAKDRAYILNGNGDPNGVSAANKGSIYQDLSNGCLYLNVDSSINGWVKLVTRADLDNMLVQGGTSPEGSVVATKGTLYSDTQAGVLYIKTTETGNTGWLNVSADLEGVASVDLDNLSEAGEKHFANPALSNLNGDGESRFNAKENVANKVNVIASYSTHQEYPSARATYVALSEGLLPKEDRANKTTTIDSQSTNDQYPTAKAVYEIVRLKENASNKTTLINVDSTNEQYPTAKVVYDYLVLKAAVDLSNVSSAALGNLLSHAQATDKSTIVNWGLPNYSAGVAISTGYSAPKAGLIYAYLYVASAGGTSQEADLYVNSVLVGQAYEWHNGGGNGIPVYAFVDKGDTITFSGFDSVKFYPFKGA